MKNDSIKAVLVLFACCLVVAVLLAGINAVTAPIIEENNAQKVLASLDGLIPGADYEQREDLSDLPSSISAVFVDKNGGGVAIIFSATSQYSSSPMQYSVGIGSDGKIIAIKQITYMESKSFGDYPQSFVGNDKNSSASVEVFGGVTYSSNAFKSGLNDAFAAFEIINQ